MGSTTLFNAVFIRPEQVVRFLLCSAGPSKGLETSVFTLPLLVEKEIFWRFSVSLLCFVHSALFCVQFEFIFLALSYKLCVV